MREATLGGVSALDVRSAKIAGKPRPAGAGRSGKGPSPRLRRIRAHLALIVGSAGFSAIMIGIILNATVMQKEHHPAPLFGAAALPVRTAAAPAPAPREVEPSPVLAPPAGLPAIAVAAAPPVAAAPLTSSGKAVPHALLPMAAAPRPSKPADGIARFLAGPHVASHPVAVARAPGKPMSTQPRTAVAAKPRPAVPVAARSEPSPAAVN